MSSPITQSDLAPANNMLFFHLERLKEEFTKLGIRTMLIHDVGNKKKKSFQEFAIDKFLEAADLISLNFKFLLRMTILDIRLSERRDT